MTRSRGPPKNLLTFWESKQSLQARYLEEKEIQAVRRLLTADRWLPFQVALETGLRIGDVLALRWSDVHGKTITFKAQKTGKLGKTAVSAETAAWLKRARRGSASVWVFPSPRKAGAHLTRQAAWKWFKAAAEAAGLEVAGVSPHSLRKVFAVALCKAEGLEAAQAALQHSSADVTSLYAFSDWMSGENVDLPLTRGDLPRLAQVVSQMVRQRWGEM